MEEEAVHIPLVAPVMFHAIIVFYSEHPPFVLFSHLFFDLRPLITPLVSSSFSFTITTEILLNVALNMPDYKYDSMHKGHSSKKSLKIPKR